MLLKHELHGWHNAYGAEIEDCKKNGWVETSIEEHKLAIEKKRKVTDNVVPVAGEDWAVAIPSGEKKRKSKWQQDKH